MKKIFFALIILFIYGCSKRTELSDSVFIPDNEYPDLPAYTEMGYNTFGANYERTVFIYSNNDIPLKVVVDENGLSFLFQGVKGNYSSDFLALKFTLPDSTTDDYHDLLAYNDTIIDLSDTTIQVEMITDVNTNVIDILEGELNFKKAQKAFVDDVEEEIILSGYFHLKFTIDNIPAVMTDGRFDFGLNNDNFCKLNN